MNVCLLIPPSKGPDKIPERVYGCTYTVYRQPELPLLYLAASLERDGYHIVFKDFSTDFNQTAFRQFVQSTDADVYVIHGVLLSESVDVAAAGHILRYSTASIIFFGPQPTFEPGRYLTDTRCLVVRGEAEEVMRSAVKCLAMKSDLSAVRGLSWYSGDGVVNNESAGVIENLDSLPFPRRSLLGSDSYVNPKLPFHPATLALTSRGCSFRCMYCVPNAISWAREIEFRRYNNGRKPPVRLRSPASVAAEFRQIKSEGYRAVSIVDDMFLFGGKARVIELCSALAEVGLPFGALARCDFILDDEIAGALARAGCCYIDLGVESFDQGLLDDVQKGMDVSAVRKSVRLLNAHGIEPKANIMFGASPLETSATINTTIREVSRLSIQYAMFLVATPFPGTAFADRATREGWITESTLQDLENQLSPTETSLISYPHLSKAVLETAIRRAYRSFYLSPRRLWFQLRRITSPKVLFRALATAWKVLR